MNEFRVAIVHDWMLIGGAEKVVEHMIEINDDPKYIERLKLKLIDIRNKKALSK